MKGGLAAARERVGFGRVLVKKRVVVGGGERGEGLEREEEGEKVEREEDAAMEDMVVLWRKMENEVRGLCSVATCKVARRTRMLKFRGATRFCLGPAKVTSIFFLLRYF